MRFLIAVLSCLVLCQFSSGQAKQSDSDAGALVVFVQGKQIGVETFTIHDMETAEGAVALDLGTQKVNLKSNVTYKGTHPIGFTLQQDTNPPLQFAIDGTVVKLTGPAEKTGQTDADAVVLESNFLYQYYYLIRRYDAQKGGPQQFKAFVPSMMQTLPISIELKQSGRSVAGLSSKLNHYHADLAGAVQIDIWTAVDGKLFYCSTSQQIEVVRQEHAASLGSLRETLARGAAASEPTLDYSAPPSAPFTAEEATVQAKGFTLAGTLLLPKTGRRPFAAVVMITGSGQQTRDEPIPLPGLEKYKPFRQIAEALAAGGVAVLRVDDRGIGGSTGRDTLRQATTSDFADDTRAQVAYLRTRNDIDPDRIALVGHSEGGTIAPMVASTDPRIAAIVLMAGPGLRGDAISMSQVKAALAEQKNMSEEEKNKKIAEQREVMDTVINGGDTSKYPDQVRLPWIKEFWSYDPLPTIRKVHQPILILQGELDQQITADQAQMLEKAAREAGNKDVTARVFPKLNHLFLPSKTGAFSEYSSLSVTSLGEDFLKTLTDWTRQRLRVN
ncbi:MAG TPA: alpha/beta fold hydrolase [Blastocatellia bacterium]|nr:alpha/beta fold hydrolase [Blastocatellia bacterium]